MPLLVQLTNAPAGSEKARRGTMIARAAAALAATLCVLGLPAARALAQDAAAPSPPAAAPTLTITMSPAASATPAGTPSATPVVSATSTPLVSATATPVLSASATPIASPTPSLLKKIGVKLQFLPPPMEGTISLGIYDRTGKLVRILHREASGDEFVAALDGYITHWDGLDDAGHPMPPGHYTASGYMVGSVTVRQLAPQTSDSIETSFPSPDTEKTAAASAPPPPAAPTSGTDTYTRHPVPSFPPGTMDTLQSALPILRFPNGKPFIPKESIHLILVPNPLDRDRSGNADVSAGIDAAGSWLQLADGLPLKRISATANLKWAALGRPAPGDPIIVFQSDGKTIEEYQLGKLTSMMAFECGDFDFPEPAK